MKINIKLKEDGSINDKVKDPNKKEPINKLKDQPDYGRYQRSFSSKFDRFSDDPLNPILEKYGINPSYTGANKYQDIVTGQSGWEKLRNTAVGSAANFVAGAIDNFNYDLEDAKALIEKDETHKYGSWVTEMTKGMKDYAEENFQVYQHGSSFSDANYWMNFGKNLSYSFGLIAGMLGEQAALSAVSAKTFGGTLPIQGAVLLKRLGMMAKGTNAIKKGIKAQRALNMGGDVLFGMTKGVSEAHLNSIETYDSTYQTLLREGASEEDAQKYASQAAADGFRMEVLPSMLLSTLQIGTIKRFDPLKGRKTISYGVSDTMESLIGNTLTKGIKNKTTKAAVELGINSGTEALEEVFQTTISTYQQEKAKDKAGLLFTDYDVFGRETIESAIGGAIGGGGFHFAKNSVEYVRSKLSKNNYNSMHEKFIKNTSSTLIKDIAELNKRAEAGDTVGVSFKQHKMRVDSIMSAIHLDYINGKETAMDGYLGELAIINEALENKDIEVLKKYGIETEAQINNMKKELSIHAANAARTKEDFVQALKDYGNVDMASNISHSKAILREMKVSKESLDEALTEIKEEDIYQELSSQGKRFFDTLQKISYLQNKKELTKNETKELKRLTEELNSLDDYKQYQKSKEFEADSTILRYYDNYMNSYQEQQDNISVAEEIAMDRITKYDTITGYKEALKKSKENAQKARSKEELEKIKENLASTEEALRKQEERATTKEEKEEVEEAKGEVTEARNEARKTEEQLEIEEAMGGKDHDDTIEEDTIEMSIHNEMEQQWMQKEAKIAEKISELNENENESSTKDGEKTPVVPSEGEFSQFSPSVVPKEHKEIYEAIIEYFNGISNSGNITLDHVLNLAKKNGATDQLLDSIKTLYEQDGNLAKLNRIRELIKIESQKQQDSTQTVNSNNKNTQEEVEKNNVPSIMRGYAMQAGFRNNETEEVITVHDDGTITKAYVNGMNLSPERNIQHTKALELKEGDKLTIKVPDDYRSIKVLDPDDPTKYVPFSEVEANMEIGSPEWAQAVPMIAYSGDIPVFFLHDIQYLNRDRRERRYQDLDKQKQFDQRISEVTAIRENINQQGSHEVEITSKTDGVFYTTDQPKTLSELSKVPVYGFFDSNDVFTKADGTKMKGAIILPPFNIKGNEIRPGHSVELREVKKGVYRPFKLGFSTLQEEDINIVYNLIKTFFTGDKKKIKEIMNATASPNLNYKGLNLDRSEGRITDFFAYLEMFLNTHNHGVEIKEGDNIKAKVKAKLDRKYANKKGQPYHFYIKGRFIYGRAGEEIRELNKFSKPEDFENFKEFLSGGMDIEVKENSETKIITTKVSLNLFKGNNRFSNADQRIVPIFDNEGNIVGKRKYHEHQEMRLESNVNYFEKPDGSAVTFINPTIEFVSTGNPTPVENSSKQQPETTGETVTPATETTETTPEAQEDRKSQEELEAEKKARELLERMGGANMSPSVSRTVTFTDQIVDEILKEFTGLKTNVSDYYAIVREFVDDIILSTIDQDNVKSAGIQKKVVDRLEALKAEFEDVKGVITNEDILQEIEEQIERLDTIIEGIPDIWKESLETVSKFTRIEESILDLADEDSQATKQETHIHGESGLTDNGKAKSSYLLKRFYNGIPDIDHNGKERKGNLDTVKKVPYDVVEDTVKTILDSNKNIKDDFDSYVAELEKHVESYPFLKILIEKLENSSTQMKNTFVHANNAHSLSMVYGTFMKTKGGKYKMKVYKANTNSISESIYRRFLKDFLSSSFVEFNQGYNEFNINIPALKNEIQKVFNTFDVNLDTNNIDKSFNDLANAMSNKNISSDLLADFLGVFGINVGEDTVESIKVRSLMKDATYKSMFYPKAKSSGIYGQLLNFMKESMYETDELVSIGQDGIRSPLRAMTATMKRLSNREAEYNSFKPVTSFRNGDKTIYARPPHKLATDITDRLRTDEVFRESFKNNPFSSSSILLRALEDEKFREELNMHHIGLLSILNIINQDKDNSEITELTKEDAHLLKRILFEDMETNPVTLDYNGFHDFRIAKMALPTTSDKGGLLILDTIVLDLEERHISENMTISDKVLDITFDQVILPELKRIQDAILNGDKDIKGYNAVSKMFINTPAMNAVKYNGKTLYEIFNSGLNYNDDVEFQNHIRREGKKILQNNLRDQVEANYRTYLEGARDKNGQIVEDNKYSRKFQNYDTHTRAKAGLMDFYINNLISMSNIDMLYAGDPAMANKVKKSEVDSTIEEKGLSTETFIGIADKIDDNLGKRLAALVTPKTKPANSKGGSYIQIIANDVIKPATRLKHYSQILDQKEMTDEEIQDVINGENLEALGKKYPKTKEYFEIESTDSAEYITFTEALTNAFNMGDISDDLYFDLMTKYQEQVRFVEENPDTPIPRELFINDDFILEPEKPIYTGQINDEVAGVKRDMYIKTSAVYLLPQMTQGRDLDHLRRGMEAVENAQSKEEIKLMGGRSVKIPNKRVRLTFSSSVKKGNILNPTTITNQEGVIQPLNTDRLISSSLVLNRDDFGIQLKNPAKAHKDNKESSHPSQMLGQMFSDGVLTNDTYVYRDENGKILKKGTDLRDVFNNAWVELNQIEVERLKRDLGLDDNFDIINERVFYNRLHRLLKREAIKRQYGEQTIDSIDVSFSTSVNIGNINDVYNLSSSELTELEKALKEDTEDNLDTINRILKTKLDSFPNQSAVNIVGGDFKAPLWLLADSNKYESLINSFTSTRLSKAKMKAIELVAMSDVGFHKQEGTDSIVYTKYYDGKLKDNQAFIPSIIEDADGNTIQFINDDGSVNEEYVEVREDGTYALKEGKIDLELLQIPATRIPTAGHKLMNVYEIAGFLPKKFGGRIVLSANLVNQKGLDFDNDKEKLIFNSTKTDSSGNLSAYTKQDYNKDRKELDKLKDKVFSSYFKDKFYKKRQEEMFLEMDAMEEQGFELDAEEIEDYEKKLIRLDNKIEGEYTKKDIKEIYELEKRLSKRREDALKNTIVDVTRAVLTNKNVERKMNAPLSLAFAQGQRDLFTSKQEDKPLYWSRLNSEHQQDKLEAAAIGKISIGVYSNFLGFLGLAQSERGRVLAKGLLDENNKPIRIGNFKVDGNLSGTETIRPAFISPSKWNEIRRSKIDVFTEKQNTATDNETEKILDAVGINKDTIQVDAYMSSLGIDKDIIIDENGEEQVVSYSYLLLSQPIIKEYVEYLNQRNNKVNGQYRDETSFRISKKIPIAVSEDLIGGDFSSLSAQTLFSELDSSNLDVQEKVLNLFILLQNSSKSVSTFSKLSGIKSNGLGKSILNSKESFSNLISSPFLNLIADQIRVKSTDPDVNEKVAQALEDGYVQVISEKKAIKGLYLKPKNYVGANVINNIVFNNKVFSQFFPYTDFYAFRRLTQGSENKDLELVREIKKAVNNTVVARLMGQPAQAVRKDLFVDYKNEDGSEHISLARYLNHLRKENIPAVNRIPLLSNLDTEVNVDSSYSFLKYNNSEFDLFDSKFMYNSLIQLIENNSELPPKNGKDYTTRDLAIDLINYSFLSGGVSEAIQFHQYIPLVIMDKLGYVDQMKALSDELRNSKEINAILIDQIKRNNPNLIREYIPTKMTEGIVRDGVGEVKSFLTTVKYERIPLDGDIVRAFGNMFKYNKRQDRYYRIQELGDKYNLSEYDLTNIGIKNPKRSGYYTDLLYSTSKPDSNTSDSGTNESESSFLPTDSFKDTLKKLIDRKGKFSEVLTVVDGMKKGNTELVFADIVPNGVYSNGKITLKKDLVNDPEQLEKIFTKEYIHAATVPIMREYFNPDGTLKNPDRDTPKPILDIKELFDFYVSKVAEKEGATEIDRVRRAAPSGRFATQKDLTIIYPATDIFEFVEGMFTEKDAQGYIENSEYNSIIDRAIKKFAEIIKRLLNSNSDNQFSKDTIDTIFNVIKLDSKKSIPTLEDLETDIEQDMAALSSLSDNVDDIPNSVHDSMEDDMLSDFRKLSDDDINMSPSVENIEEVSELFETNPELANQVYEAVGITGNISDGQKQQAQQLYSQYLEQNPSGTIEGFKDFLSEEKTEVKSSDIAEMIRNGEITYTDEQGKPCAEMGGRDGNFTKGSEWEIVKDLEGYPSHAQGGVDIKLGKDGFSFTRDNGVIEAKHGLVLPVIKAQNGLIIEGEPNSKNKAQDGSLPSYFEGSDTNPIQLDEATITAEAPDWLKYRREYVKNNPFNIDEYVENRFNNPVGKEKIEKIDPEEWRKKIRQQGLEQRYNSAMDYVGEQLVKNKPQGDLSRAEWLNQMSDKEEEIIKRNPKYQSSLWADTKRGLQSQTEVTDVQTINNILNSSDYSDREKRKMLKDYADHPMMSKLGDTAKMLSPITVGSKALQSIYRDDTTFTGALKGEKNNASFAEDALLDVTNLAGTGIATKLIKGASKLAKADKLIDATKVGSKVLNKTDDLVFYHGGLDPKSTIDNIDPFRIASRQNKKNREYAGFYMSDNIDEGSFALKYHKKNPGSGLHEIRLQKDSRVYEYTGSMERIKKSELEKLQKEGYDYIKGTNLFDQPEYVLLNKNKATLKNITPEQ